MKSFSPDAHRARSRHLSSIALEVRDFSRLFNSMDPSPFEDKDLDSDAEAFIVSSLEEHLPDEALTLRIYLDQWPAEDPTKLIRDAIHNYFDYRANFNHLEFRRLMRRGRKSLLIGSLFLVACLLVSRLLLGNNQQPWAGLARESLTIAGWVAMWRPIEIYLYDWWPLRRQGQIYGRLSRIPVEVVRKDKP